MLDNEMPGATLEAPDIFTLLAVPLWPHLPLALGYSGGARWGAFYLALEKVTYNDGASSDTGDTGLFLAFKRHPLIEPSLWDAHMGSADEEARHWSVVDRQHQVLYLAASEDARRLLATQWPRYTAPLEYTPEELKRLLTDLEEAASPPDWAERLAEALRESRANHAIFGNETSHAPPGDRSIQIIGENIRWLCEPQQDQRTPASARPSLHERYRHRLCDPLAAHHRPSSRLGNVRTPQSCLRRPGSLPAHSVPARSPHTRA